MPLRLAVPTFILDMGNSDLAGELSKWGKLKIADEVAKFRRRGTQSEIMAHARCQAAIHPRLFGVQLPRMQVNTHGTVLPRIKKAHSPTRVPVRQKPKIGPASKRRADTSQLQGRHREFYDCPAGSLDAEGAAWRIWHSIIRMPHGEDARIVREAKLTKNIESPEGVLRDGKAGSAVPAHRSSTTVLKQLLRAPCVLSKLISRHLVHGSMAQTVAGNFMASAGDALDHVWMLLCNPAQ